MSKFALIGAALLGIPVLVSLSDAAAQDGVHRTARVPTGQQLRLNVYATLTADCSANPPPEIRIVTPPRNGTLLVRTGKARVARARNCQNAEVPIRAVFYRSNRGFVGQDQVAYEITRPNGSSETQTVSIMVTPQVNTSPSEGQVTPI